VASASGDGPVLHDQVVGEVDGARVHQYTLANHAGMKVDVLSYGGIVKSVEFPDRNGEAANVVLGFKTIEEYVSYNPAPSVATPSGKGAYFGALIGRYANRVAGGHLDIEGAIYRVPINDGTNALHGGDVGFDQKVWSPTAVRGDGVIGVRLEHVSPAGDMGFPGTLTVSATYTLDEANRLALTFEATTDAPTVVNLTNHSYWNLAGEAAGTVYDHVLRINADGFTPVDEALVPTGEVLAVAGGPFDFCTPTAIGARIRDDWPQLRAGRGYDHNWVLNQAHPRSLVLAATVEDHVSGRRLHVHTTQPGLQFYSGNFLDGTLTGSGGRAYRQSDGFALETQHFPDAPNHPEFASTMLYPGERYHETTIFELLCGHF
jgi:aldose 1-epimerase